jgi:predicted CXXCH cytochrome family protein
VRWLLVLVAACSPAEPAPTVRGTIVADSTIAAADYIGPAACGECHADEHARWSRSLHAVMNQRASTPGAVIGHFDGSTLGPATFARAGADYTMTIARTRYRVTRTIGRRGLQEYVGIADGSTLEVRLPFAWWPRRGGWAAQSSFDPWLVADDLAPHEPWAERCPWCHSTYPFAQRLGRTVGHGLEQYFDGPPHGARLAVEQQVTVGISCESCHLGGRAHAAGAPIHFVPIGAPARPGAPRPTTFAGERADPAIVNAVCAQCHSGPSPRFSDHTATRNSSEALDLAASPCTTARCVDCHDPHRADARASTTSARAIAACTHCHAAQADPAHARHATTATCLDCHMPRVVMGIDRMVRTHRISSPTDRTMLASAPNACNLCHLDRSVAWTTSELHLPPVGDDDAPAGEAWLASKEPAIRIIAAHAYAAQHTRDALPAIEKLARDPLAYVRAWAQLAIDDLAEVRARPAH